MQRVREKQLRVGEVYRLEIDGRYFISTAEKVMRGEIVRGLVELITNADDSYARLEESGRSVSGEIVVSISRKRKRKVSVVRVKDRAQGMDLDDMATKLRRVGGITSGFLETHGRSTRGLMGRGAKECVVFGPMTYTSIKNGMLTEARLEQPMVFKLLTYKKVGEVDRLMLGIPSGNGTVVTLEVRPEFKIPTHEFLKNNLQKSYSLRDIASSPKRKLLLLDEGTNACRPASLVYHWPSGERVIDETFAVPGYPEAQAHFVVQKASERIKFENSPYWEGGVLIKSGYAIHGITFFSRDIENNPRAEYYFGQLTCPYIDQLAVAYERREAAKLPCMPDNPSRVIDPLRDEGLVLNHPFTKALYGEASVRIKDLLRRDEEAESQKKKQVENQQTTKRLKRLAGEVSKFIKERTGDVEPEDEHYLDLSEIPAGGMRIVPGSINVPLSGQRGLYVYVRPVRPGDNEMATVATDSKAVLIEKTKLDLKARGDGIYYASFLIRGVELCHGVKINVSWQRMTHAVRVAVVQREETDELLTSDFVFEKPSYTVREGKQKQVRILARWPGFVRGDVMLTVKCEGSEFVELRNSRVWLRYHPDLRAAAATVRLLGKKPGGSARLLTSLQGREIATRVRVLPQRELGADYRIQYVDDENLGGQRTVWSGNVLKINTRHPSVGRYLGPGPDFAGQNSLHFKLLVAELVADSVARRILELNASKNLPMRDALDVFAFYSQHLKHRNDFLEIAHRQQIPESELSTLE